jgi:hypothetical protein
MGLAAHVEKYGDFLDASAQPQQQPIIEERSRRMA